MSPSTEITSLPSIMSTTFAITPSLRTALPSPPPPPPHPPGVVGRAGLPPHIRRGGGPCGGGGGVRGSKHPQPLVPWLRVKYALIVLVLCKKGEKKQSIS